MHATGELTVVGRTDEETMVATGKISITFDVQLTRFFIPVIHKGIFYNVFGTVIYDDDELRIDNPVTRSRLICRFSEYDEVEGNMQDFVLDKCNTMITESGVDAWRTPVGGTPDDS